jgi:hypothetical protein
MVKSNNQNVNIPCFGDIRGCLVNHCDVAYYCRETTENKEVWKEHCAEDKMDDEMRGI